MSLEWWLLSGAGCSPRVLQELKQWGRMWFFSTISPSLQLIKCVFNMALTALHSMGTTSACCLLGFFKICHHPWNRINFWSNALGNDSGAAALKNNSQSLTVVGTNFQKRVQQHQELTCFIQLQSFNFTWIERIKSSFPSLFMHYCFQQKMAGDGPARPCWE